MEYMIGVILSLAVAGFAAIIGLDRERDSAGGPRM